MKYTRELQAELTVGRAGSPRYRRLGYVSTRREWLAKASRVVPRVMTRPCYGDGFFVFYLYIFFKLTNNCKILFVGGKDYDYCNGTRFNRGGFRAGKD